jgi:hypothetical protein
MKLLEDPPHVHLLPAEGGACVECDEPLPSPTDGGVRRVPFGERRPNPWDRALVALRTPKKTRTERPAR